jgi:ankyrin repeat protein
MPDGSAVAGDALAEFIIAAVVPRDAGHATGTLARADSIRAAHPDIARASIHAAAVLGDDAAVERHLAGDPAGATAKGGPHGWDPLTHLCFSRYLRLDRERSNGFVRAARVLLDAGASANTGWFEPNHAPRPEWESAIYGAAGVARHAELTRLLLERGADPNDEETPYHAPEGYDNDALKVLLDSGKLTADSLTTILLRKTDWHDLDGVRLLLGRGADPNRVTRWGRTALQNAVLRDNHIAIIEALLDAGGDPLLVGAHPFGGPPASSGMSAVAMAARRGRADVLDALARRDIPVALEGVDRLIAACARDDAAAVRAIAEGAPELVTELLGEGGTLLAEFAGVGNTDGVGRLLDLGIDVASPYVFGDGYFGIAPMSTALHVAAWRAHPATVRLLIERDAPVDARDGHGRTPIALAVRACVDSYWTHRRTPESVKALLGAGASPAEADFPSGYTEVDDLLRRARRASPNPSPREHDG